jgi:hypothetical protein
MNSPSWRAQDVVEALVEGDHAGLVHRLRRDSAEHDVVGVEVEVAVEVPAVATVYRGAVGVSVLSHLASLSGSIVLRATLSPV